jgi:hypothetical protein
MIAIPVLGCLATIAIPVLGCVAVRERAGAGLVSVHCLCACAAPCIWSTCAPCGPRTVRHATSRPSGLATRRRRFRSRRSSCTTRTPRAMRFKPARYLSYESVYHNGQKVSSSSSHGQYFLSRFSWVFTVLLISQLAAAALRPDGARAPAAPAQQAHPLLGSDRQGMAPAVQGGVGGSG